MENLDLSYLNDLVTKAQQGSSNAFAELYAATWQKQYAYAYRCLKDESPAKDALQETFVRALRNIRQLQNPELFTAWLSQICFQVCQAKERERAGSENLAEEEAVTVGRGRYVLKQIESLPLTESQVILMRYCRGMETGEIADTLNLSRGAVRFYLKSARKHLKKLEF